MSTSMELPQLVESLVEKFPNMRDILTLNFETKMYPVNQYQAIVTPLTFRKM